MTMPNTMSQPVPCPISMGSQVPCPMPRSKSQPVPCPISMSSPLPGPMPCTMFDPAAGVNLGKTMRSADGVDGCGLFTEREEKAVDVGVQASGLGRVTTLGCSRSRCASPRVPLGRLARRKRQACLRTDGRLHRKPGMRCFWQVCHSSLQGHSHWLALVVARQVPQTSWGHLECTTKGRLAHSLDSWHLGQARRKVTGAGSMKTKGSSSCERCLKAQTNLATSCGMT